MKLNGKEVDFSISRLKDAGMMEIALKHMAETEKKVKTANTIAETIGQSIEMFQTFFREATGEDVLADCEDMYEAKKTYYEFLDEVRKQKDRIIGFSPDDIK